MKGSKDFLIGHLRFIISMLENGDSLAGRISYDAMRDGLGRDEFHITGMYRTGNSEGQGGMIIIDPNEDG